jgi:hypothetical protein
MKSTMSRDDRFVGNDVRPQTRVLRQFAALLCCLRLLTMAAEAVAQGPPPAPEPAMNPDVQVLTRGPVHEAFAAPVVHDPGPGLVVGKQPPQPVEELPPDQKPAGQNVQWISGYWSWDQSRNDFLWVSGVWREPPPGRQWVPGYWHQVEGGYQWVPGAWVPVNSQAGGAAFQPAGGTDAAYLPAPPASLETGPNSPAPSANVFWSPGSWDWQDQRYLWRPGFWAAVQPSWVWIPAHFVWTPGGYLFVGGYWDLPLANRGMLFAPVYYPQPVYMKPAYVFTPSITIATGGLVANLFVQPSYGHYCFGDYYDRSFLSVGIVPWFSFTYVSGPSRPVFYDPLFSFYASVKVHRDPGWITRVREDYVVRRDNVAMRPPRTYIEQTRIIQRNVNVTNNVTVINNGRGRDVVMARPIHELAAHPEASGGVRMERVSAETRRQFQDRGVALQRFRDQRSRNEREGSGWQAARPEARGGQSVAGATPRSRPLGLPASPVAAPIHPHAATVEAFGPATHVDHGNPRTAMNPQGGSRPAFHGGVAAGQPAHPGQAAPLIRHQPVTSGPMPEHLPRLGQPVPHDVPGTPSVRPAPTGSMPARGEARPLHAPPQYTHRQPPPAPRPVHHQEPR